MVQKMGESVSTMFYLLGKFLNLIISRGYQYVAAVFKINGSFSDVYFSVSLECGFTERIFLLL